MNAMLFVHAVCVKARAVVRVKGCMGWRVSASFLALASLRRPLRLDLTTFAVICVTSHTEKVPCLDFRRFLDRLLAMNLVGFVYTVPSWAIFNANQYCVTFAFQLLSRAHFRHMLDPRGRH